MASVYTSITLGLISRSIFRDIRIATVSPRFPRKFIFKLHINPNICCEVKFPRATYHTIVPSTEELYQLNSNLPTETILFEWNSHEPRGLIVKQKAR